MAPTGYVFHGDFFEHRTGPGHPERPERVRGVDDAVRGSELIGELEVLEPRAVDRERLAAVHDAGFLERLERQLEGGPVRLGDGDTAAGPNSFRAALLASGGVLESVDRVMAGTWDNAFVACRPPGHHAERDRAMGFCLVNHVAVAAAHARDAHGLERVAILDWDVHHGNGTQHLFESDPGVFYASLHQFPFYPGTGAAEERGRGDGEGVLSSSPRTTVPTRTSGRSGGTSPAISPLPRGDALDFSSPSFGAPSPTPLHAGRPPGGPVRSSWATWPSPT